MAKAEIRPIRIDGNVAYITLTRGCVAVIDAADVPKIEGYGWYAFVGHKTFYAARKTWSGGKQSTVLLHRALVGPPDGKEVDHIDGDGLNNRRSNLRLATRAQNARNIGLLRNNTSGFKGVMLAKGHRKWRAQIEVNGRRISLGVFDTPEQAYDAYCEASARHHGKFARVA